MFTHRTRSLAAEITVCVGRPSITQSITAITAQTRLCARSNTSMPVCAGHTITRAITPITPQSRPLPPLFRGAGGWPRGKDSQLTMNAPDIRPGYPSGGKMISVAWEVAWLSLADGRHHPWSEIVEKMIEASGCRTSTASNLLHQAVKTGVLKRSGSYRSGTRTVAAVISPPEEVPDASSR